jgi:2-oxoglutarate dehydrogenase E1 component
LNDVLKKYKSAKLVWAQEEPSNMGYWSYILRFMAKAGLEVVARKASASPATGYSKIHKAEQEKLLNHAFEI